MKPASREEDRAMRSLLIRRYVRVLPLGLPLLAAGCDDDDWSSGDVIDIIYAAGEVVLAILRLVL
jgi:hypothetical protein